MPTVSKVRKTLAAVCDPDRDVHNITVAGRDITVTLRPDAPDVSARAANITTALKALDDAGTVNVTVLGRAAAQQGTLTGVKNIIAVSSCKGGVGKSTMAAHLAAELARRGLKTGLLDADVYGPSIPTLFNLQNIALRTDAQNRLVPVNHAGIQLMSFGFLLGDNAAIMRGPIVTRYIQQILLQTAWGELDFLIIDMPPGTGDIHITITQTIRLTGAVIVTTPHTLSLIDVARGILMFEQVSVPILGVIENMAYFQPGAGGDKHYLFGTSSQKILTDRFGVAALNEIPVLPDLGQTGAEFSANPFIQTAADRLFSEIKNRTDLHRRVPHIETDAAEVRLYWENGDVWAVGNRDLRLHSRDAYSVDEMTGKSKIRPDDIRADIAAVSASVLGNYAINVVWNDGHKAGIYPYKLIEQLARKTPAAG